MRRGLFVPLVALTVVACAAGAETSGSGYSWVRPKPHPALQRTEVAGAAIGHDVYVIGGFFPPNQTTATVERLRGKRWSLRASLPVALNHAAAVGHHGHVYVA